MMQNIWIFRREYPDIFLVGFHEVKWPKRERTRCPGAFV